LAQNIALHLAACDLDAKKLYQSQGLADKCLGKIAKAGGSVLAFAGEQATALKNFFTQKKKEPLSLEDQKQVDAEQEKQKKEKDVIESAKDNASIVANLMITQVYGGEVPEQAHLSKKAEVLIGFVFQICELESPRPVQMEMTPEARAITPPLTPRTMRIQTLENQVQKLQVQMEELHQASQQRQQAFLLPPSAIRPPSPSLPTPAASCCVRLFSCFGICGCSACCRPSVSRSNSKVEPEFLSPSRF
jgi:hypothetical protein